MLAVGQVVTSSGGSIYLICGHIGDDAVLLPLIRGDARKRSHVKLSGQVFWDNTEFAQSGYIDIRSPRQMSERMLSPVGEASEALQANCLKALVREMEANDRPRTRFADEVKAHFDEVAKQYDNLT